MVLFRRVPAALAALVLLAQNAPVSAAAPAACPDSANPVCAADGRTYQNPCLAGVAGTTVSYAGACLSVPVGDAAKVDRAADLFLAKVFFASRDLGAKAKGYAATLARFDAVAADRTLSAPTRVALNRIRERFSQQGAKILQSHFRVAAENWFRANLPSVAPQPGVDDKFAVTRFSWGPLKRVGTRLYAVAEVSYESRLQEYSSSFDVVFDRGQMRASPLLSVGKTVLLRKGALARVDGSDVVVRLENFVDSPCPDGAWCFWQGQSVETAWYKAGDVRRVSDAGEAFGYRLEIVATDYKTYAAVRAWPSQWN